MPITFNVLLKDLDKARFFQGEKGLYANLVLYETKPGTESADYGDYIVKQQGEQGDRMPILGNGKYWAPKAGGGGRRQGRQGGGGGGGRWRRGRDSSGRGNQGPGRRRDEEYDQRPPRESSDYPTHPDGGPDEDEIPF